MQLYGSRELDPCSFCGVVYEKPSVQLFMFIGQSSVCVCGFMAVQHPLLNSVLGWIKRPYHNVHSSREQNLVVIFL